MVFCYCEATSIDLKVKPADLVVMVKAKNLEGLSAQ